MTNVFSVFLSMSLTVTFTPGTTAPEGSVTLPVTSAELVACPQTTTGYKQIMQADNGSSFRNNRDFMVPSDGAHPRVLRFL